MRPYTWNNEGDWTGPVDRWRPALPSLLDLLRGRSHHHLLPPPPPPPPVPNYPHLRHATNYNPNENPINITNIHLIPCHQLTQGGAPLARHRLIPQNPHSGSRPGVNSWSIRAQARINCMLLDSSLGHRLWFSYLRCDIALSLPRLRWASKHKPEKSPSPR